MRVYCNQYTSIVLKGQQNKNAMWWFVNNDKKLKVVLRDRFVVCVCAEMRYSHMPYQWKKKHHKFCSQMTINDQQTVNKQLQGQLPLPYNNRKHGVFANSPNFFLITQLAWLLSNVIAWQAWREIYEWKTGKPKWKQQQQQQKPCAKYTHVIFIRMMGNSWMRCSTFFLELIVYA